MNIVSTLHSLNINSEPFYPSDTKKVKATKVKTVDNKIQGNNTNTNKVENKSAVTKSDKYSEESYDTISKLKNLNLDEIKEYIPKKFKLVSKDNSSDK